MISFVIKEGYEGRALRENTLPSLKVLKVHIHVFILFQCRSDNSYILVHSAVCDFVKLLKVLTDIKTGYNFIVYISTLPVFIEPWITKVVLKIYLKKKPRRANFFLNCQEHSFDIKKIRLALKFGAQTGLKSSVRCYSLSNVLKYAREAKISIEQLLVYL